MDAVKFLKEYERMCETCFNCDGCPIQGAKPNLMSCGDFRRENASVFVSVVEKWAEAHPVKTRLQDFMEKHPNARTDSRGIPHYYPTVFGYCGNPNGVHPCATCDCRGKEIECCWGLPVED